MTDKNALAKKEEELEQILGRQLSLLKNDSMDWVKIGGLALAGGLLTYAIIHRKSKKKEKKIDQALATLEREGLLTDEIEERLKSPAKSSFWPSMSQRLLLVGLAFAKEKLLPQLFTDPSDEQEKKGDL
ncbi:hypothetical protein [Algoriphagus namhaensis]